MSIFNRSLDQIYASPIGVRAVITGANGGAPGEVTIRAIDKTDGLEIPVEGSELPTILPAACIRVSEMKRKGIEEAKQLIKASITLNGTKWDIIRTLDRRTPHGKGELALLLRETKNG
jgi:hypothetical protein